MDELHLCKEIYSNENISNAIVAYKGLASISLFDCGNYWSLSFSDCKYDNTRTVHEFENYLIGLENC